MHRRDALAALAAPLLATAAAAPSRAWAQAEGWRQRYPVVSFSSVSSESQGATEARFKDFSRVFMEQLGSELRIFTATDYAGTIQPRFLS